MLQLDRAIIHLDIINKCFICDISKCRGICCVEGDSGAPLEKDEAKEINKILPKIIERLTPEARLEVEKDGACIIDFENDLTTNTIGENGPCVFTQYNEDGSSYCLIEKAYEEGLSCFQKPISCHLYPIRIQEYKDFDAVNYHEWHICKDAVKYGESEGVPIYVFLKGALIRKYGKDWYEELCTVAIELRSRLRK